MILILGALEQEISTLVKLSAISKTDHWGPFLIYHGTLVDQKVCLVKCGVGKVLSAMLTQHLIDKYSPTAIIFTGLAGALNTAYQIGDVVLGLDCIQHDLDATALGFKRGLIPYTEIFSINSDQKLLSVARTFKSEEFTIREGRILTGDQFISKSEHESHKYLTTELNGDAVDMEGASVATVASLNSIAFILIRTISDSANGEAPQNFGEFLPVASKHASQLVLHILKQCGSVPY